MFDTLYLNVPNHGIITVGTNPRPPNATLESIVERFVYIRTIIDQQLDEPPPPRRYYG